LITFDNNRILLLLLLSSLLLIFLFFKSEIILLLYHFIYLYNLVELNYISNIILNVIINNKIIQSINIEIIKTGLETYKQIQIKMSGYINKFHARRGVWGLIN